MTTAPIPTNIQKCKVTIQERHNNLNYKTVVGQLRLVSWGDYSHQTGVVNRSRAQPSNSPQQCEQHFNLYFFILNE